MPSPAARRPPYFIAVIFLVLFGANAVSAALLDRLLRLLDQPEGVRWAAGAFFLVQLGGLALLLGAPFTGRQPGAGMGRFFLSLVFIWNLLLLPLLLAFWIVQSAAAWATGSRVLLAAGPLGVGLLAAAAVLLAGLATWQLGRFRVRRLEVALAGLPQALDGFTIAHLSDLHVGRLTRGRVLNAMTRTANALDADLAAVTGDLVNFALSDLPAAAEAIRGVRARHGVWICEGNHDLMEGRGAFEAAARATGLNFLFDEAASFEARGARVELVGTRWNGEEPSPGAAALLARPADAFRIFLAHHPHAFEAAAAAGVPLTLAGHTHGGQLRATERIGFGPWFYRYWEGLYRKGQSALVVSNGTGNWFPLRWNTPAEIVHLTLRAATPTLD